MAGELAAMEQRKMTMPDWRFVYDCGHQLSFAAPRTSDELMQLSSCLEQLWTAVCTQCSHP